MFVKNILRQANHQKRTEVDKEKYKNMSHKGSKHLFQNYNRLNRTIVAKKILKDSTTCLVKCQFPRCINLLKILNQVANL